MFKCILYCLGIGMKMMYAVAAFMDKDFKNRLMQRNIAIVIKTLDGKNARTYLLQGGKISSVGRVLPDPDVCVTLSSAKDLYRTMRHLSPQRMIKSFVDMIRDGKLKIECKIEPCIWFSETLTKMLMVYCDRSKPKKFLIINT